VSAEPWRLRLRWLYGDATDWHPRTVVLSRSPEEYEAKGFTPQLMSPGMADIQRCFGMPIDPRPRPRRLVDTVRRRGAPGRIALPGPWRLHAKSLRVMTRACTPCK
jgi:hypothetical protein